MIFKETKCRGCFEVESLMIPRLNSWYLGDFPVKPRAMSVFYRVLEDKDVYLEIVNEWIEIRKETVTLQAFLQRNGEALEKIRALDTAELVKAVAEFQKDLLSVDQEPPEKSAEKPKRTGVVTTKNIGVYGEVIDRLKHRFIAFDVETTGLFNDDRIVELGAVVFEEGVVASRFGTLVNPGIPIGEKASAVNHITNGMLLKYYAPNLKIKNT